MQKRRICQQFRTGQVRLSGKKSVEAPPVEVPAVPVRTQQGVVVAPAIIAPPRTAPVARLVILGKKPFENTQLTQDQVGVWWDAFANTKPVVGTCLNQQDGFDTETRQFDGTSAPGRARTYDHNIIVMRLLQTTFLRCTFDNQFFGGYTLSVTVFGHGTTILLSSVSNRLCTSR